jgi:hypothetical protein
VEASSLPVSDILTEEQVEIAFAEQESGFANEKDDIFTPRLTLWAFLSRVRRPVSWHLCVGCWLKDIWVADRYFCHFPC